MHDVKTTNSYYICKNVWLAPIIIKNRNKSPISCQQSTVGQIITDQGSWSHIRHQINIPYPHSIITTAAYRILWNLCIFQWIGPNVKTLQFFGNHIIAIIFTKLKFCIFLNICILKCSFLIYQLIFPRYSSWNIFYQQFAIETCWSQINFSLQTVKKFSFISNFFFKLIFHIPRWNSLAFTTFHLNIPWSNFLKYCPLYKICSTYKLSQDIDVFS